MLFRQIFDNVSGTYTYLIAASQAKEALLVDPVIEAVPRHLELLDQLFLQLVAALDTHIHADHFTRLAALRGATRCTTLMREYSRAECVSARVSDSETVRVRHIAPEATYAPGHMGDSYFFLLLDRVLTGDTRLARGTERTDFQNGDPLVQRESLFGKRLKLPKEALVYPAHDNCGLTVSTIGEEARFNPRLQVTSSNEDIGSMNVLDWSDPKMMLVAVPANLQCDKRCNRPEPTTTCSTFLILLVLSSRTTGRSLNNAYCVRTSGRSVDQWRRSLCQGLFRTTTIGGMRKPANSNGATYTAGPG